MAVSSSVVAVSTSAAVAVAGSHHTADIVGSSAMVANTGTVVVYLGGPTVTTSTGFPLGVGATVSLDLLSTDSIYAIAASAGQLTVLQVGI